MKDIKDMSIREIVSTILLTALGVGLWDLGTSTIGLIQCKLRRRKTQRKWDRLMEVLQDKVDNDGFTEGLDEEHLQLLRDWGIKFL